MSGLVDLHTHTTASDGTLAPRDLVRTAVRHGVGVLAITDHDSTEGLPEAREEATRHPGLVIVPGIEINCDVDRTEIHVLGYLLDVEAAWFQDVLRSQRDERVSRVHRIAERLAELGMPIDPAEVLAEAGDGAAGRPHVARVMVRRGWVRSEREAFDRYLRAGGPANVTRRRLTPAEAVELIRRAHGVPVLAHPGLSGRDDLIPGLVEAGLMGLEAYYGEHSAAQTRTYLELCRRHDLVATGGSDYHGPRSGHASPPGTPRVPPSAWDGLQSRAVRGAR